MSDTRKFTNKLIELLEEGNISEKTVIEMCLNYMSEDDVKDMVESNGIEDLFE